MADHRRPGTGRMREEIQQLRTELRAVTDAMTDPPAPQFSVADLAGDGRPVLRPVTPRRRAVHAALTGRPPPVRLHHPATVPFPGEA